ncbi:MAG: carboxypeptidase regulatory-like domain-containing protein [Bacteroidia bacterium]|nr:carboxypeptidase regulatory-like domain-containing protein [Bacteroidia bacterium]
MKYLIISIFSILGLFFNPTETNYTYTGFVKDRKTGEIITSCSIVAKNYKSSLSFETISDKNGKFILKLQKGEYLIEFSKPGYSTYKTKLNINSTKDTTITANILLSKISSTKDIKTISKKSKYSTVKSEKAYESLESSDVYVGAASRGERGFYAYDIGETSSERTKYLGKSIEKDLKAGTLTAGEINDFSKWTLWNDLNEGELKSYISTWFFLPKYRFCVLITNQNKIPLNDVEVVLKNYDNKIIWQSRSDNTGKAELWANLFDTSILGQNDFEIEIAYNGKTYSIEKAKKFENGINNYIINTTCDKKTNVDIVFAVDATGSMGDEIEYLQTELYDVIEKIKLNNSDLTLRMGSVFYRDIHDSYITKEQGLTSNIREVIDFIKEQSADGGGDEPEAVDAALQVAIEKFDWSKEARTRIVFLVLDASPHQNKEVVERIHKYTEMAAKLGIRIVPVVCSGIDKSGEYLMRSIALATNGNYVFLTDNSGIGNPHLAPSTDKYDVETLNNLLVRLMQQYVFVPECNNTIKTDIIDSLQKNQSDSFVKDTSYFTSPFDKNDTISKNLFSFLKYYPNPCKDILYVECSGISSDLYITDLNGKIIMKVDVNKDEKLIKIDLSQYPSGIYFLKYCLENKCKAGKFVLIH